MKHIIFSVLFLISHLGSDVIAQQAILEGHSEETAAALVEAQAREQAALQEISELSQSQIFRTGRRWTPGSTLRVAFLDGPTKNHRMIANVAQKWCKYANIKFDFGYDPVTQRYRRWSPRDEEYVAEIRIAFDLPLLDSVIGTCSVNRGWRLPSQRSMNLGGMDRYEMPPDWEADVLHEFGHALGFVHEHQHGACNGEMRWVAGATGEPSVYDVMLNQFGWNKKKVDLNFKLDAKQSTEEGDVLSAHDKKSIMHYALPVQIFIKGSESPCFIANKPKELSAMDQANARRFYPKASGNPRTADLARVAVAESAKEQLGMLSFRPKNLLSDAIAQIKHQAKPRVLFFIADESQRALALEISQKSEADFAPLFVRHLSKAFRPDMVEVRYLRHPEDRSVAQQMLALLQQSFHIKNARVSYTERSPSAERPGDIEVWFCPPDQMKRGP